MNTRINIHSFRSVLLALFLVTLTACGGSSSGSSTTATDPATIPLTESALLLAQEALDVISDVLDSSVALIGTQIDALQAAFDGFVNTLTSTGAITAAEALVVQNTLDAYTGTTDASAGALTAEQIQLAQDALDAVP